MALLVLPCHEHLGNNRSDNRTGRQRLDCLVLSFEVSSRLFV
jgi:hypothetical protein